ncbi:hypothetical protein ASF18_18475 [Methylobacterium sp. Leaf89]|nr:hypothetical protein ASF18_18475 [Methylobacterium sp. Leaf89]
MTGVRPLCFRRESAASARVTRLSPDSPARRAAIPQEQVRAPTTGRGVQRAVGAPPVVEAGEQTGAGQALDGKDASETARSVARSSGADHASTISRNASVARTSGRIAAMRSMTARPQGVRAPITRLKRGAGFSVMGHPIQGRGSPSARAEEAAVSA